MKWLRLYDDLIDDVKVQRLPPVLFKHWINLLCLANKGETRGELPPLEDIAFRLRIDEEQAAVVLAELTERGFIDQTPDGALTPHNWTARQRNSDDGASRVANWRQKQQTSDVTQPPVTARNGAYNPVTQPVTLQNEECYASRTQEGESEGELEESRGEGESAPALPPSPPAPIDPSRDPEQPAHLIRAAAELLGVRLGSAAWNVWRPAALRMLKDATEPEILEALSVKIAEKRGKPYKFEWLVDDLPYLLATLRGTQQASSEQATRALEERRAREQAEAEAARAVEEEAIRRQASAALYSVPLPPGASAAKAPVHTRPSARAPDT